MDKRLNRAEASRSGVAGFVMVELMLVVSIIGILAAVALPSYQEYTARARVTEALELGAAAQSSVNEFYARWGVMPASNAQAGLPEAQRLRGRFVEGIEVKSGGVLVISLTAGIVSRTPAAGQGSYELVMRPAIRPADPVAPLAWVCQLGEVPEGMQAVDLPASSVTRLIDPRYLPMVCRKA